MTHFPYFRHIYNHISSRISVCYNVGKIALQRCFATALLLLLLGFAAEKPALAQNYLITLSDLSEELAPYQGISRFDGVGEGIEYAYIGKPKYDEFFTGTAHVTASIQQLRFLVEEFKQNNFSLKSVEDVLYLRDMARYGSSILPEIADRIDGLLDDAASFDPSDFGLRDILKARRIIKAVKATTNNLNTAKNEVGALLASVTTISKQVEEKTASPSVQEILAKENGQKSMQGSVEASLSVKEEITAQIESGLRDWKECGKFEKSEDCDDRIEKADLTAIEDSLTQQALAELVDEDKIDWSTARNTYDADTEVFTIMVKDLEPFKIIVPLAEAKAFDASFQKLQFQNPTYDLGNGNAIKVVRVEVTNPARGKMYVSE